MGYKRNKRKIEFISEEKMKDMMKCGYSFIQDEFPKEYDLDWKEWCSLFPKRILKEEGEITIKDEKE